MKEELVTLVNKEFRVDSRLLARSLDHRHRTILENIDKYQEQFEELGELPFETEAQIDRPQGGSTSIRYALLNEDQCYFIMTLMRNNKNIVKAKLSLVKAFRDARTQLAKRDIARLEGKKVRLLETDHIRELVEYAKGQGSTNSDMYYMLITKLTNSFLGIKAGMRPTLSAVDLQRVAIVDMTAGVAVSDGIGAGMVYKDIYKLVRERINMLPDNIKIGLLP